MGDFDTFQVVASWEDRCFWHLVDETWVAATHPLMHRTASAIENDPAQNAKSAEVEKLCLRKRTSHCRRERWVSAKPAFRLIMEREGSLIQTLTGRSNPRFAYEKSAVQRG